MTKLKLTIATLLLSSFAIAQKTSQVFESIETHLSDYESIALEIWNLAEMGYQEYQSSNLLKARLESEGFSITTGVAEIPTAFVAEYGTNGPVIGILGEFDALPGLSQKAVPFKESANAIGGHGCGHHLFGTASLAAAVALKDWLIKTKTEGRIRFYGTPLKREVEQRFTCLVPGFSMTSMWFYTGIREPLTKQMKLLH